MRISLIMVFAALVYAAAMSASAATGTANVKVTPLGGIDGEFCPQDRALVFEDPNGTRILYDPGRTVAGPQDPRLGKIDIILVTHMHGDHVGNAHNKAPNSGTCDKPDMSVSAVPNTSAVNIALAKKAKIITGSEMQAFFAAKLRANGGNPGDSILARFGGSVTSGGVRIATVTALHSNGLDPAYVGGELGKAMTEAGIAGYVGEATGYVLRFSNGLVVYLSGDTGITSDQEKVVRGQYGAKLAVMNIGDGFHRSDRSCICDQRARQAQRGDRFACKRSRDEGRQGAAGQQDRYFHEGRQGSGARAAERQDDGIRRRWEMRRRVLRQLMYERRNRT